MTRLLRSPWLVSLVGCLLYLATTAMLIRPEDFPGVRAAAEGKLSPGDDPSWKFRNPEFEQWVEELKSERESLAERERQLRELQARLQAERQEILSVTQAVRLLQEQFDKDVIRIRDQEVENLKRQSKIIAGMSPEGAAAMLNSMPEAEFVRILSTLKPETASAILDALSKQGKTEAQRAADLSERLRLVLPPGPGSAGKPPTN